MQPERREILIELPQEIPVKSTNKYDYPLFAIRISKETNEKKLALLKKGAKLRKLIEPLLFQIFDEALRQLEEQERVKELSHP